MKKLSRKVVIGTIIGSLALSGTVVGAVKAYDKNIKVRFASIKLILNGKTISTKAEPFIYNGNVYAPVATVANGLGIGQRWNNNLPSVEFTKKDTEDKIRRRNILLSDNYYYYHRGEHTYIPLFADVYLDRQNLDEGKNYSISYRVTDYLNGGGGEIPQTTPDGGKTLSAKFISGSVSNEIGYDTIDNGSFAFLETSDKGKTWVSTFNFKDGKLTRGASHVINEDPNITVNVSEDLVTYYKDGKLIKAQTCYFVGGEIKLDKEIPVGTGEAAATK